MWSYHGGSMVFKEGVVNHILGGEFTRTGVSTVLAETIYFEIGKTWGKKKPME